MKTIVANWKMHLGIRESVALARGVLHKLRGHEHLPEVIICPSFTALGEVHKVVARSRVNLGAQNCGPARSGAFTGEVSPVMLEDVGVTHAIIGHSERRNVFGETEEVIRDRMQAVLSESKIVPILCVGETEDQKEAGQAAEIIKNQLAGAFTRIKIPARRQIFVAYEPVWAIGTGKTPEVGEVVEMHMQIRVMLDQILPGVDTKILYGGSVKPENAYRLLREGEVDGVLVGGASLKLQKFGEILDAARDVVEAQRI